MKKNILNVTVVVALACPVMVQALSVEASVSAGLGYDSNAYHSPGSPYTDYSVDTDPSPAVVNNPTITPVEQSGFFIPLAINASLNQSLSKGWMMKGAYDFDGSKYIDSKLDNADMYDHLLRLGGQYTLTNTNLRSSHIYAGLRMQDHQQTYADRDNGAEKTTSGTAANISDLYSYSATGLELGYDYKNKENWDVELTYRQEGRDYTNPPSPAISQDHDYTKLAATLGIELSANLRAEFDAATASRDYDFRHAHIADGTFSNVLLTYDYTDLGVTLKQDVGKSLKMSYGYAMTQRTDNNVGYNDYDLTEFTLGARYDFRYWLSLKGKLTAWQQDYPNAWNFDCAPTDCPALTEHRSADGTTLSVKVNVERAKTQDWWAEMEIKSNNNTDKRYAYDRNMLMAGVTWKF